MRAHGCGASAERATKQQSAHTAQLSYLLAVLQFAFAILSDDGEQRPCHLAACGSVRGTRSVPCRDCVCRSAQTEKDHPAVKVNRRQVVIGDRIGRGPTRYLLNFAAGSCSAKAPSLQARLDAVCLRHLCCQEDKAEGFLHPRCDNRPSKKGRHWEKVRTPTSPACLSGSRRTAAMRGYWPPYAEAPHDAVRRVSAAHRPPEAGAPTRRRRLSGAAGPTSSSSAWRMRAISASP